VGIFLRNFDNKDRENQSSKRAGLGPGGTVKKRIWRECDHASCEVHPQPDHINRNLNKISSIPRWQSLPV